MDNNIDVVITWVDASDPKWQVLYKKYYKQEFGTYANISRFFDAGTLKYLFRSLEKFMPWVRKIHLVTIGHYPKWLNLEHPKINLVTHEQIFPSKKYLPTFNPSAIEMTFANIPDLADKFIYFNDDMIVFRPLSRTDFFVDGLPRDFFILRPLPRKYPISFYHKLFSDMYIVDKVLNKNTYIKRLPFKFFMSSKVINLKYGIVNILINLALGHLGVPMFKLYHFPQPFLKRHLIEAQKLMEKEVKLTLEARFRTSRSLNQYLYRFYSLIKLEFKPLYKPQELFFAHIKNLDELKEVILKLSKLENKVRFICLNDSLEPFNDDIKERYVKLLASYLDKVFDKKSTFEL